MYSDAVRNFIRNLLKVPSSENFLISVLIQYKVFPNDFLKIGQMIKDEPKSAWKTNKNFLSNFVDLSQYWKFLKILGNPDVISYKKISYKKKRVFDFSGFQWVSEVFSELYGVSVDFREFQWFSESFSPFQSYSVVFKAFQSISERFRDFREFQSFSELFREFQGVLADFREF